MTIKGAEGTPGADWCVTIVASDSNGGEYIVTEHQRDPDAPPTDAAADGNTTTLTYDYEGGDRIDSADSGGGSERASSAISNPDTFEVRDPEDVDEKMTRLTTMLKAETMAKHLSADVSEVGSEADGGNDGGRLQRSAERALRVSKVCAMKRVTCSDSARLSRSIGRFFGSALLL